MDTQCILVAISVILLAHLLKKYYTGTYNYWRKRGIPCVPGALPFFGNILPILTLRQDLGGFCNRIYDSHRGRSMVGFYQFQEPSLLIRDPEVVKQVLVGDFSSFHVNVIALDPVGNPLVSRNPSFVTGDDWKTERSRLTVALMSARKLKILFGAVKNVCRKFDKYLEDVVKKSGGCYEANAMSVFTLFTGEVVANAGFGVEGDFFSNGSGPNSFRETVTGLFDPTLARVINQNLLFTVPTLNKFIGATFIPHETNRFFRRVVSDMIEIRRRDGITGSDFLQIALDTQKAKGEEVNELDVTVSATSFFLDGYETSASTLGFLAYQVAANPRVQEKMRAEVARVLEKYGGEMTYEAVAEMTYMDQALNESMRLYPAVFFLEKKCNERCKLVGSDGIECEVEPGTSVLIPIFGIHRDKDYWEDPEVFDPERFDEANKNSRPKSVFMPFGEGPRECPGQRFGVHQVKAAMATMLRSYRLEVSEKTKLPLRVRSMALLTAVEGGLWIKFRQI